MTTRPKNPNLAMQDDDDRDEELQFDKTMVQPRSALSETFSERTVVVPRSKMPDYMPPTPAAAPPEELKVNRTDLSAAPKATPVKVASPVSVAPPVAKAIPKTTPPTRGKDEVTQPSWVVDPPSWRDAPAPVAETPPAPSLSLSLAPNPAMSPASASASAPVAPANPPTTAPQWNVAKPVEELKMDAPPAPSNFAAHLAVRSEEPRSPAKVSRREPEVTASHFEQAATDPGMQLHYDNDVVIKSSPLEKFKALPKRLQMAIGFGVAILLVVILKALFSSSEAPIAAAPVVTPKVAEAAPVAPAPPPPANTDAVLHQFDSAFFKTQGQARGD